MGSGSVDLPRIRQYSAPKRTQNCKNLKIPEAAVVTNRCKISTTGYALMRRGSQHRVTACQQHH